MSSVSKPEHTMTRLSSGYVIYRYCQQSISVTAGSWQTAAFESSNQVATRSSVLARSAGTLLNLGVTQFAGESGQALTHEVAVAVNARPVVAVHRCAAVHLTFAPRAVVT